MLSMKSCIKTSKVFTPNGEMWYGDSEEFEWMENFQKHSHY